VRASDVARLGLPRTGRARPGAIAAAVGVCSATLVWPALGLHVLSAAALAITAGGAHLLAAAAWTGGLVGLVVALRSLDGDATAIGGLLHRFARSMTVVLGLLLAGGIGLAVCILPAPGAIVRTAYGQVLLIKLAMVLGVLVVSAANHRRLVPLARRGSARAVQVLRMNVAVEQVGILAVLLVTEILTRQNPGGLS
jgi:putative copper export protein